MGELWHNDRGYGGFGIASDKLSANHKSSYGQNNLLILTNCQTTHRCVLCGVNSLFLMKITSTIITFRIDIDLEDCEVDMVLKEMTSRGISTPVPSILCDGSKIKIDKSKLPKTPTEASVDFALNWLYGYVDKKRMCVTNGRTSSMYTRTEEETTELEKIGIEVKEIYGLMQGCCHFICECDISIFSNELVEQANKITHDIFKRFVRYHKG